MMKQFVIRAFVVTAFFLVSYSFGGQSAVFLHEVVSNGTCSLDVRIMRSSGVDMAHPKMAHLGGENAERFCLIDGKNVKVSPRDFDSVIVLFESSDPAIKNELQRHRIYKSNGEEMQVSYLATWGQIHLDMPTKYREETFTLEFLGSKGPFKRVPFRVADLAVDPRKFPSFESGRDR
jgi:hypothetical protein